MGKRQHSLGVLAGAVAAFLAGSLLGMLVLHYSGVPTKPAPHAAAGGVAASPRLAPPGAGVAPAARVGASVGCMSLPGCRLSLRVAAAGCGVAAVVGAAAVGVVPGPAAASCIDAALGGAAAGGIGPRGTSPPFGEFPARAPRGTPECVFQRSEHRAALIGSISSESKYRPISNAQTLAKIPSAESGRGPAWGTAVLWKGSYGSALEDQLGKNPDTWKAIERKVCELLDTKRRGAHTGDGANGKSDNVGGPLGLEIKHRAVPSMADVRNALVQAEDNLDIQDGQLWPIAVVHRKGDSVQDSVVAMRLSYFIELLEDMGMIVPTQEQKSEDYLG